MGKLILVKHSLPEINPDIPSREWHLSAEGIARCTWLADELGKYQVQRIVSSTEPKAKQTAEEVAKHLGLQSTVYADLHENDRTGFSYLPKVQFEQKILEFFTNPDDIIIGKESARQAQQRFANLINLVLGSSNVTTAVIAHGTVNSLFTLLHNDIDVMELWKSLQLPSFVVLEQPHFSWDKKIYNYLTG